MESLFNNEHLQSKISIYPIISWIISHKARVLWPYGQKEYGVQCNQHNKQHKAPSSRVHSRRCRWSLIMATVATWGQVVGHTPLLLPALPYPTITYHSTTYKLSLQYHIIPNHTTQHQTTPHNTTAYHTLPHQTTPYHTIEVTVLGSLHCQVTKQTR